MFSVIFLGRIWFSKIIEREGEKMGKEIYYSEQMRWNFLRSVFEWPQRVVLPYHKSQLTHNSIFYEYAKLILLFLCLNAACNIWYLSVALSTGIVVGIVPLCWWRLWCVSDVWCVMFLGASSSPGISTDPASRKRCALSLEKMHSLVKQVSHPETQQSKQVSQGV